MDFSEFWQAWQIVSQNFAPGATATPTTDQDHVYGAIQGMVASFGDPYTTFFPPAQNNQFFQAQIAGSFSVSVYKSGRRMAYLTVIAPLKGTPAEAAGIRPGDIIVKIGNTATSTLTIDQAVDMIEGKNGTTVTLTIARQGVTTPIVLTIYSPNH